MSLTCIIIADITISAWFRLKNLKVSDTAVREIGSSIRWQSNPSCLELIMFFS